MCISEKLVLLVSWLVNFDTVVVRDNVLRGGPWRFDNAMVVVAEYDGL